MENLTLTQFIAKNELNPEDGGLGLSWFRPDEMVFVESKKIDSNTELHIFSDGATKCGLLDTSTRSDLLSEDDLSKYEEYNIQKLSDSKKENKIQKKKGQKNGNEENYKLGYGKQSVVCQR